RELTEWLRLEQWERLYRAAIDLDEEFGLMLAVLCYTGMRLRDALSLRCDDIDLAESFAYVRITKNGDPRPVYLPPFLVDAIRNHPRGADRGEARLFRFHKGGHIYSLLATAAAHAHVTMPEREAFHIFCHTYGTWMRRYAGLDTAGLVGTGRWK